MRNSFPRPHGQRGATLIVGLIMLVLITLMVTAAFTLSGSNLKSVGNMQFRNEAMAAANTAIERVIGTPFTTAPAAQEINVDINNDGATDYVVQVAAPACVRVTQNTGSVDPGSECLPDTDGTFGSCNTTPPSVYGVVWDLKATVTDPKSGTQVSVHQGVNVASSTIPAACP